FLRGRIKFRVGRRVDAERERLSSRGERLGSAPSESQIGGAMSRILTAAGVIVALALVTLGVTAAAPGAGQPRYLNAHASIKDRVNDLLDRMTLQEKVGQMDQIVIGKLRDTNPPADGDCNNA